MTYEQILAFGLIAVMMAAFLWEKFRYDVVACVALVAAVVLGLLPAADAAALFDEPGNEGAGLAEPEPNRLRFGVGLVWRAVVLWLALLLLMQLAGWLG
mgnify:CR=1 FL=1